MISESELISISQDFLKAIADAAKAKFGPNPERLQKAGWLVRNGSGMSGQIFHRKVCDGRKISMYYQLNLMQAEIPEQQRMEDALIAAGIQSEALPYGFFLPLINRWLRLQHPFEFNEPTILDLLREFAGVVLSTHAVTRLRIAIEDIDAVFLPVIFKEGIVIRHITEEELWELGDVDISECRHLPGYYPNSEWKILDIELKNERWEKRSDLAYTILDSVLTSLRLESSGSLRFVDLGSRSNFGIGALGFTVVNNRVPQEIGRYEGRYSQNLDHINHLRSQWPKICSIVESDNHYLRVPAKRLMDGGSRNRPDDAILDYAIGLEALLTAKVKDELSYRFALRGATILGWDGGDKHQFFRELHSLYAIRSTIVHGDKVKQDQLEKARSIGGDYLRKIWWWYFAKGFKNENDGSAAVDARILD